MSVSTSDYPLTFNLPPEMSSLPMIPLTILQLPPLFEKENPIIRNNENFDVSQNFPMHTTMIDLQPSFPSHKNRNLNGYKSSLKRREYNRLPETFVQKNIRNNKAINCRKTLQSHFTDLMNVLQISDQRHKTCPSRDKLIRMAILRIEELRQHIQDVQSMNIDE